MFQKIPARDLFLRKPPAQNTPRPLRYLPMLRSVLLTLALLSVLAPPSQLNAATLHLGAATIDITPDKPVALDGQRSIRQRMRKLRGDVSRLDAIAQRIVTAWDDALEGARHDIRSDVPLHHHVKTIDLPYRKVTILERSEAMTEAAHFKDIPAQHWNFLWNQKVVDRFDAQKAGTKKPYPMELHAVRLGDCAIATNDFELYTDFGIQMKARSPGTQTFIIQLAGPGTYLPTERAVKHGGYGAVIQSSQIGPEGGQVLVEETVQTWKQLWPAAK